MKKEGFSLDGKAKKKKDAGKKTQDPESMMIRQRGGGRKNKMTGSEDPEKVKIWHLLMSVYLNLFAHPCETTTGSVQESFTIGFLHFVKKALMSTKEQSMLESLTYVTRAAPQLAKLYFSSKPEYHNVRYIANAKVFSGVVISPLTPPDLKVPSLADGTSVFVQLRYRCEKYTTSVPSPLSGDAGGPGSSWVPLCSLVQAKNGKARFNYFAIANKKGEGTFGCVFRAKLMNSPGKYIDVALKVFKNNSESAVVKEAAVLHLLPRCANIARLLGAKTKSTPEFPAVFLVTEWIGGGTLKNAISPAGSSNEKPPPIPSISERVTHLVGVSTALIALKVCNVVHCDLKADNVMLRGDSATAVLVDLGIGRVDVGLVEHPISTSRARYWMAPPMPTTESGINAYM